MTKLMQIQPFIQAYVLAISSILETEVTVVDQDLLRVGGTGVYQQRIGQKISHDSFFQQVLTTGKPGIIKDVKEAFACHRCEERESCRELANLAYPILQEGQVVGIIGIIAFQPRQREQLLNKQAQLEDFLRYMSMLIESKLSSQEMSQSLQQQIGEVISTQQQTLKDIHFLGESPKIQELLGLADKIRGSDSTVLITGESGTGKEVLAKMLHTGSSRGDKLMIAVNCAAIPENLVESELFGYDEGAFTGAKKQGHAGKFELAQGSTLFLDEIGDMPLHVQTKLLRVLQERKVERLGGRGPIDIDVRVICATNQDLERLVEENRFRRDLYYRLNVIPMALPPLRERREDIPLFIRHFIMHYNRQLKKNIQGMEPEAQQLLVDYSWPGNVRELKNMVEYLANIAEGETIRVSDLPGQFAVRAGGRPQGRTLQEMMQEYEKLVLASLARNAATLDAKEALAAQLGISRATLYRKLAGYGLLDSQ